MRRVKMIFAGGGTGGHIIPGLVVAGKAAGVFHGADILFVTDRAGNAMNLFAAGGFRVKRVTCARFMGRSKLKLAPALAGFAAGILESVKLLKQFKPDVIIGTGGYASAPVVAAGVLTGKKIILLEQNYFPGLATRVFAGLVREVELSFPGSEKYLSRKARFHVTGNPVREEIIHTKKSEGLERLGLSADKLVLAVFGGSSGARSINLAMESLARGCAAGSLLDEIRAGWQIIHITGEDGCRRMKNAYSGAGLDARVFCFLQRMDWVYACADLLIARAGGNTVAETTARGIAAVFVPYPHAAGNHQELNARWVRENGGCFLVKDGQLASGDFYDNVLMLMKNHGERLRMAEASGRMGSADAADKVIRRVEFCLKT